jgi:hypothetical protein
MPICGSLTLSDVAAKTDALAVAWCSRCDRAGRYPVSKRIERRGGDFTVPDRSASAII